MENRELMTIENENEVIELEETTELVETEGCGMSPKMAMAIGAGLAAGGYLVVKKGVPLVVKGAKKACGKVKGFFGKFKKDGDVIEADSKDVIEEESESND